MNSDQILALGYHHFEKLPEPDLPFSLPSEVSFSLDDRPLTFPGPCKDGCYVEETAANRLPKKVKSLISPAFPLSIVTKSTLFLLDVWEVSASGPTKAAE